MTYTTLLITFLTATLPLTAIAKDVKGVNCMDLRKQGLRVTCPQADAGESTAEEESLDKKFQDPEESAERFLPDPQTTEEIQSEGHESL